MNSVGVIVIELPVVSAFLLGAVAFTWQKFTIRIDALHDHMTKSQEWDTNTGRMVHSHDRQLPQLSENLAVLTSEVERHLAWHERHHDT